MPLAHVLDVNAVTEDHPGGPRLVANWTWAGDLLPDHVAHDIARTWFRALEALVRHAQCPGAGGYSPSDLLVPLAQEEIDELEDELSDWGAL